MNQKLKCFIILFLLSVISFFVICYSNKKNDKSKEMQNTKKKETIEVAISENTPKQEVMPRIKDIIIGDGYSIVLCEDGSVWNQEYKTDSNQEESTFHKMSGLNNIIKIMDLGPARYALASDGYIYAWGINNLYLIRPGEDWYKAFAQPVRLEGISGVVDMEAKNRKAFALDRNGNFYAWGLTLYISDSDDPKPGFPAESKKLVENVKKIYIGSGEYHYFMREDGSLFSIMGSPMELIYVDAYIFPDFNIVNEGMEESYKEQYYEFERPESTIRIDEGSKWGKAMFYDMGKCEDMVDIAADNYTMFLTKKDDTLWYWNSNRIKYHDSIAALADAESKVNVGGAFVKVDYQQLFQNESNQAENPIITDICTGGENTLFLTDTGQVFMSEYRTTEIKEVEYYNRANTNPDRTVFTAINTNMHLKKIFFRRLDYEKIVRINTDSGYHFSLLDEKGDYFHLDMTPQE